MFTSVNNVFQQLYIANSKNMCLEHYMEDHHVMFKYFRCKPTMIYIQRSLVSWNYIFVRRIIPTVVQSTFGKPFTQWLWARIKSMFVCIGKKNENFTWNIILTRMCKIFTFWRFSDKLFFYHIYYSNLVFTVIENRCKKCFACLIFGMWIARCFPIQIQINVI